MRTTSNVAVAVAALILTLVLAGGLARQALATCSIGGGPSDYPRYAERAIESAPFVFIGTVISERSIPRPPNTTSIWESVVAPQAMLTGELAAEPLVISYTGFLGADCSGGPRLREGERVLIAIDRGVPSYGNGEEAWQMHGTFSKVLLEDGQATLEWTSGSQPLGTAETIIRQYGVLVGADEARIGAAIDAANTPSTEGPAATGAPEAAAAGEAGPSWPYVAGGAALLVLLVAVMALRRRLRSPPSRPSR